MNTILIFFLVALVVASIMAFVFYRLGLVMANLEERMVGMWLNAAGTTRMLIYRADSTLQGDIVWLHGLDEKLLGARILHSISAKGRTVVGQFVDPATGKERPVQLRLKNPRLLSLLFSASVDGPDKSPRVESWKRIEA